jgi:ubiquinone/menaquinone biosynthesis C-methylase UbiE
MDSMSSPYAGSGLWERLQAGLRQAGSSDVDSYSAYEQMDHFHTGAVRATEDLVERLGTSPGRILDIGGGIGGPARYLAKRTKSPVVVAEPTSDFCDVGVRLNALAGLGHEVVYMQADGTRLPFAEASFDVVWMQQAAMNIEDKVALWNEVYRILTPGGLFLFQEIVAGQSPGPLSLPVPWAMKQEDSILWSSEAIQAAGTGLGFVETFYEEVTDSVLPVTQARLDSMLTNGVPPFGVHLLFQGNVIETARNQLRNVEDGRISFIRAGWRKPS